MPRLFRWVAALALFHLAGPAIAGPPSDAELPRTETREGRHALIVDGEPFLMLGAQASNSSNYPAMLPDVWPVIEALHATTPVRGEPPELAEGRTTPALRQRPSTGSGRTGRGESIRL